MNITYRNFISEDTDHIISFWNENSGWETDMDRTEFGVRFCSSPFGNPIIMLAIDNEAGNIVGLFCFLPFHVTINNKEEKCYRFFGAVFKESFREKFGVTSFLRGTHPLNKLYVKGVEQAVEENAVIMYGIPDPRLSKVLRALPFDTHKFPLWSYKLSTDTTFEFNDNTYVKDMDTTDQGINHLWEQTPKCNFCTLTKNAFFYQCKVSISHNRYRLKGFYINDKLVGLFTLSYKTHAFQWTIGDLLTLDHDEMLTRTLQAACFSAQLEYLRKEKEPGKEYKASVLATPLIEQKMKELNFYKDNYDFVFAVQLINKSKISKKEIAFENWYVSATD